MDELIQLPQYDPEGRRIPDTAVYWWHGTTKAEQDNIRLKMQVDTLIQSTAAIAAKTAPVPVDNTAIMEIEKQVGDLHRLFNAPPPPEPKKKLTAKQKIAAEIEKRTKANELKIAQEILRGLS